jgi:hypothetical protein
MLRHVVSSINYRIYILNDVAEARSGSPRVR